MQKITPCLWFDTGEAEEAAKFYTSIFKNSRIVSVSYHTEATPGPTGSVLVVYFELEGQSFMALNGGSDFKFSEAISLTVNCDTQDEIDDLWTRLTADGGEEVECGWLKDKYGLSWQIVPAEIEKMIADPDPQKVNRVMEAILRMRKLDLAELRAAYEGQPSASR
jgi:predicted 3-demethylubiquinone-9 3-methyltransferase (glyoxalase superfamily)